jgi:hypothetical protein
MRTGSAILPNDADGEGEAWVKLLVLYCAIGPFRVKALLITQTAGFTVRLWRVKAAIAPYCGKG